MLKLLIINPEKKCAINSIVNWWEGFQIPEVLLELGSKVLLHHSKNFSSDIQLRVAVTAVRWRSPWYYNDSRETWRLRQASSLVTCKAAPNA